MELFEESGIEVILLLAFRSGRRTFAYGAVLWVAATCGSVLGLMVGAVGAVGSPAAVGTAATSRASVFVGVLRANSSELKLLCAVGVILGPNAKLSIDAFAFVAVPKGDPLVLNGPIPVGIAHCTFDFVWGSLVD